MGDAEKRMGRGELAKELRDGARLLRHAVGLNGLAGHLEKAAALLEDDSVERNTRRYQVIKSMYGDEPRWFRLDSNQGRIMGIRSTGMENQPENENRWHGSLDAAIDAWLEGEGK